VADFPDESSLTLTTASSRPSPDAAQPSDVTSSRRQSTPRRRAVGPTGSSLAPRSSPRGSTDASSAPPGKLSGSSGHPATWTITPSRGTVNHRVARGSGWEWPHARTGMWGRRGPQPLTDTVLRPSSGQSDTSRTLGAGQPTSAPPPRLSCSGLVRVQPVRCRRADAGERLGRPVRIFEEGAALVRSRCTVTGRPRRPTRRGG
jgi:hypothetical protein